MLSQAITDHSVELPILSINAAVTINCRTVSVVMTDTSRTGLVMPVDRQTQSVL